MQLDYRDEFLADVLPKMLGKLTLLRKVWSNPQTEEIFKRLVDWDCVMARDSIEASIYHVF